MSAEQAEPGKLPVRLVIALLAVIAGVTALVVGLGRADDPPAIPSDAIRQGDIAVYGAYVREPATYAAAAYFTIVNVGESDDTLVTVSSPIAKESSLHDVGKKPPTAAGDGTMDPGSMVPTPTVVIEPGQRIVLEPAAGHMMLDGITVAIAPGSTVNLILVFEHAGTIAVKAPVIGLTDSAPSTYDGAMPSDERK